MERLDNPRFFYRRIMLDEIFSRKQRQGNHLVTSIHAGLKVIDSNSKNFQLSYCPNPYNDDEGSTPLKKGIPKNFKTQVPSGCFENSVVQAGVWVLVEFTSEDEIVGGGDEVEIEGAIEINDGELHTSSKITIAAGASVEILPADGERKSAYFQWKSGGSVYIGDPAALALADYQESCEEWLAGTQFPDWKNKGSLHAKSPSGDVVYSRRIHK